MLILSRFCILYFWEVQVPYSSSSCCHDYFLCINMELKRNIKSALIV
jgi:hypothetical protein